jgi:hypothetical protein
MKEQLIALYTRRARKNRCIFTGRRAASSRRGPKPQWYQECLNCGCRAPITKTSAQTWRSVRMCDTDTKSIGVECPECVETWDQYYTAGE